MEVRPFHYAGYSISAALIIFIFYGIGTELILYYLPESIRNEWQTQVLGISQVLFILIPTLLIANHLPLKAIKPHLKVTKLPKLLRLDKFPDTREIGYSLLALLMFQIFISGYVEIQNAMIPEFLSEIYDKFTKIINESYSGLVLKSGIFSIFGSLFFIALIPGVCEEFLMRGFLQKSLEEVYSPARAIIFTGLLFGIIHFNPIHLIPLILIGFMLGLAAYITKSLYTSIIMHFANNAFSIVIMTYYLNEDSSDIPLPMSIAVLFFIIGGLLTIFFCYKLYIYSRKKNFLNEHVIFGRGVRTSRPDAQ